MSRKKIQRDQKMLIKSTKKLKIEEKSQQML